MFVLLVPVYQCHVADTPTEWPWPPNEVTELSREIRDEWRKRERDKMKIRTIGQAAGSVRNFPCRIYNGEQLEACRQLGPEIRRVGSQSSTAL